MPPAALAHVETWIFDLDETLYPPAAGLLPAVNARITSFIRRELGLGPVAADRLRAAHWRAHGLTMLGLMAEHDVDPTRFLAEVHAVDLAGLTPDAGLAAALEALPGRCIVHTNSARAHALAVLEALGLMARIEAVFAIEDKGLVPKPDPAAYAHVLRASGAVPARAAMVEDTPANLAEPARLGMATVWLDHAGTGAAPAHVEHRTSDLAAFLRADAGDSPVPAPVGSVYR